MQRLRVIIASPFAGPVERNLLYARAALLDSIKRGEAPFASHLLYTQVLNDKILDELTAGLEMEESWLETAELLAIYEDYGMSPGMNNTLRLALGKGIRTEFRRIEDKVVRG